MENKNCRAERAVGYLHDGCNCAQAVLRAFQEELGKNDEELSIWAAGFGSGMGSFEGACGALCGAVMAVGLLNKSNTVSKSIAKEMTAEFKEQSGGAIICGELKGIKTGKMLCSCDDCVRHGVMVLEKRLC